MERRRNGRPSSFTDARARTVERSLFDNHYSSITSYEQQSREKHEPATSSISKRPLDCSQYYVDVAKDKVRAPPFGFLTYKETLAELDRRRGYTKHPHSALAKSNLGGGNGARSMMRALLSTFFHLLYFISSNVGAFCSYTYNAGVLEQGLYTTHPWSCFTSNSMGLWVEQVGGSLDEFKVYVETDGPTLLGQLIFYGNGDHKNYTLLDFTVTSANPEFVVVIWCVTGPNNTGTCEFQRTKWTIADCQACPAGSVREHGECSVDTPPTDTVCLSECPPGPGSIWSGTDACQLCPPGLYQNAANQTECMPCAPGSFSSTGSFGSTECVLCPLGSFGNTEGEFRETCSGLCPANTYGDSFGLTECTKCPYQELAPVMAPEGLTSIDQCSSFQTSGFWQRSGSGSVEGGTWTASLSRGVKRNYTDALLPEVASAMQTGTYFETIASNGWALQAGSRSTGFPAAAEYNEEIGVTTGEFFGYEVSDSVVNSLSTAVSSSIIEYTETGCELECPPLSENPFSTAYGWRWIHLISDPMQEELVLSIETCETKCLYHPDNFPQCPPGRCANPNCTVCFPGSFADPEVDKIASLSSTEPDTGGSGVSAGAIVGIACGAAIVVALVGVGYHRWWLGQRKPDDDVAEVRLGTANAWAIVAEPVTEVTPSTVAPDPETLIAHAMPLSGPDYKDQVNEARHSGNQDVASRRAAKLSKRPGNNGTSPVPGGSKLPDFKDEAQSMSGPDYKDQVNEARHSGTRDVVSLRDVKLSNRPGNNRASPKPGGSDLPDFKDQAQSTSG